MKLLVIGGGTSGTMAASYFKSYWGDKAEVTMVYDHKHPGIGVGESLTPVFDAYLKAVGISTLDLIKDCNATIKLGLKFKNWVKEGHEWYHSFPINEAIQSLDSVMFNYNAVEAYDILNDRCDGQYTYGKFWFQNNAIPSANNNSYRHALHVDATLFSKYVEQKFKGKINVIDGVVSKVNVEDNKITSIELSSGQVLTADAYIDASGYERILIKNFDAGWVDMSADLPTNKTIPNPLFKDFDEIPPYTTATASKNGWILDVPLSNRRGTGYVYSSKFTTDEEARTDFNKWLIDTHGVELQSNRIISFTSGYYKNQWSGNCLAIGLASGFIEPLEATSLHQLIIQIDNFTRLFQGTHLEFDRKNYNTIMSDVYDNAFRYIRFFYHTKRSDSDFWKYMTETTPDWLKEIEEKFNYGLLTSKDIPNDRYMFESTSFNCIGYGHGMITNKSALKKFLEHHYLQDAAQNYSNQVISIKQAQERQAINHKQWINFVKSSPLR